MSHGVEARVTDLKQEYTDHGYGEPTRWSATLVGGRIFERQRQQQQLAMAADTANNFSGVFSFEEEVRWIDLGLSDALAAARSPSRSVALAAAELTPLVREWIELASGGGETLWGRERGGDPVTRRDLKAAVGRMLGALGEIPGVERPSERALWVAALINPCGADAAAWPVLDIRPAVLRATTPLERLGAAKTGLIDSIYKLKGGKWPMGSYYWQ